MRRALLVALLAVSALAADRGKYKDWDQSPAGSFMTEDERRAWKKISSEADAEKFVNEFLAKREPGFTEEVTKRAQMADKYLTIGKTPGSKTLRGKLIVMFGPPSGMTTLERSQPVTKRDNPVMAGALSNSNSGPGGRFDNDPSLGKSLATATVIRTYSITYNGLADDQDVTFVFEADGITGDDRFASKSGAKEAQKLFERAAQTSIRKEP